LTALITTRRLSIRQDAERTEWEAIRELCCRNGDNGQAISRERWELFAKIWIEPYEKLLPQWSFVAYADGRVIGYLTGCPDSQSFACRRFINCTLPLLGEIAFGRFRTDLHAYRFARQSLGIEKSAERSFARAIRREISRSFPAHLHVNVDAGFRGVGVGRRLLEDYLVALRADGVPGVHLFCGREPLPFYRRIGFGELAVVEFRGTAVFALGMALPK
jgi:GNAT superfamily N-acetyltransferase